MPRYRVKKGSVNVKTAGSLGQVSIVIIYWPQMLPEDVEQCEPGKIQHLLSMGLIEPV